VISQELNAGRHSCHRAFSLISPRPVPKEIKKWLETKERAKAETNLQQILFRTTSD
jgi:hypothetical protein